MWNEYEEESHRKRSVLLLNKQPHHMMAHGGKTKKNTDETHNTNRKKNKNKSIAVVGKKSVWISTAFSKDVVCFNHRMLFQYCVCGEPLILHVFGQKKISLLCRLIHAEFWLDYSFAVCFHINISFSLTLNLTTIKSVLRSSFIFHRNIRTLSPEHIHQNLSKSIFFYFFIEIFFLNPFKMWKKVWFQIFNRKILIFFSFSLVHSFRLVTVFADTEFSFNFILGFCYHL